jgi:membrane-associated phospholipid phosphatase
MRFLNPSAVGFALVIAIGAPAVAAESSDWIPSSAQGLRGAFASASHPLTGAPLVAAIEQDPTPQASPPPEPAHTGFRALAKDTVKDFASFPRRRSTWVILGVGGALAALAHPGDTYVTEHLVASRGAGRVFVAGKYLGAFYTQIGVALGIYTIGRYVLPPSQDGDKTNKWSHLGFDLLRVQFVSQALVQGIKRGVRRDRPNGECCAFPSGHSATAFAVASVLERHLGYRFAWPTAVAAMYVATSRLHDNKHYLSDVLFGAAVGTAAGWTVVGRHGRDSYAVGPQPVRGGIAVMAMRTFR